jgi:hypothetical protein
MSAPVPLFNRNQGGIAQAEAEAQSAQAAVEKMIN